METARARFGHGPDAGKLVAALWLFVSPWMLNYSQVRLAVWNSCAVAIVVGVSSTAAMLRFTKWEEWINVVAGFWLIASPLLLDYTTLMGNHVTLPAAANHLAVGLFIIILSLWELNLWEAATTVLRREKRRPNPP